MVEDLPTGYYLENFNFLLDFVSQNYTDVLSEPELAYRNKFLKLSLDAQRLYVRLAGRRGPLFRVDKLVYDEIDCIPAAVTELTLAGLLNSPAEGEIQDFLSLIVKQELIDLFEGTDKKLSRTELDKFVQDTYTSEQVTERLPFQIVEPLGKDYLQVYKLLFFGNLHQDFTTFVLRDLGISPYENYVMDSSARYFDERSVVDGVLQSYALREASRLILEEADEELLAEFYIRELQPIKVNEVRLLRRYSRIFNTVARQFERYGRDVEALDLYEKSSESPARERRSRIHEKLGDTGRAIEICREMHALPLDEAESEFAVKFSTRLSRRHKLMTDWMPQLLKEDFELRQISVDKDPENSVEMSACRWFVEQGEDARYVENGLLSGLFGLYFWGIIFAPVKGAFFNPFQRGPADLFSPEFKITRQSLIEAHLKEMTLGSTLVDTVNRNFSDKLNMANHFVNWRWLDQELLDLSLERIPVAHLKAIFERILRDTRNNRSGFPDLIVFPNEGGYCLSEIKGPGDKLQDNQRRWFRLFAENDIPANIVNVIWQ